MSYLVLVRHGQSKGNELDIIAGHTDHPLTNLGKKQARELGELLKDLIFHRAYTSHLSRAQETLKEILISLKLNLQFSSHVELNERSWGEVEGKFNHEPGEYNNNLWRLTWHNGPKGGETISQVKDRIHGFFKREILPKLASGENVLVVGHGTALRVLRLAIEEKPIEEIATLSFKNAEAAIYELGKTKKIKFKEKRIHKHVTEGLE